MAFVYWIRAPHHNNILEEGYVGFTSTTVEKRLNTHRSDSKRDKCKNYPLYRAFEKYGESLVIETLVEGPNDYCLELEFKLRPTQKIGWNLNCGGEAGTLGSKASDETRRKKSAAMAGEKNHFYGKTHSPEVRQRMSEQRKGKARYTAEQRQHMSESRKGRKLNLSDEQRANRSKRARARRPSDETRAKLSKSRVELGLTLWRANRANKDLWAVADKVYDFLKEYPDAGEYKVSKAILGRHIQCDTLLKALRGGWNPSEDMEWLQFKQEYESNLNV